METKAEAGNQFNQRRISAEACLKPEDTRFKVNISIHGAMQPYLLTCNLFQVSDFVFEQGCLK